MTTSNGRIVVTYIKEELAMVDKSTTVSLTLCAVLFTLPVIGYGAGLSGIVAVNGIHISYETHGAGPALVLLNDGVLDRRMWDDQVKAFAAHYQVIRYDFRGWGQSTPPREPFSLVDDLYHLLTFLRIEKAVLLGSLVGGGVAIDFALEHPEMVDRLVVVAPMLHGFRYSKATASWAQTWHALAQSGNAPRLIELYMNDPTLGRRLKDNAATRQRLEDMLSDNFPIYGVDFGALLLAFDPPALSVLPTIRTPTLIVTGDTVNHDLRVIMEMLQRGIPDARRMVIPHTGCLANIEKPEEFNRIVLDWLNKRPAEDGKTEINT
jgi:3-oxoadipate enol-lactonase